jgi:hypothetical protein
MAASEKNMKIDLHYSFYVVSVIDVLGQKNRLKELVNIFPDQDPCFKKKIAKVHEQTAFYLENLRDRFEDFFHEKGESALIDSVPEEKKAQFKIMRKSDVLYSFFSDTIVAAVDLETKNYHTTAVNGIFNILGACGGLMLFSLSLKKPFRAGIEVGLGTRLKSGEVYGTALACASELEDHIAQFPRIVIGAEMINYLKNLSDKNPQMPGQLPEDIELCKQIADKCLKMITQDSDGNFIVDYLGREFIALYSHTSDSRKLFKTIFDKAFTFVKGEYSRFILEKDEKLSLRYRALLDYFESKVPVINALAD